MDDINELIEQKAMEMARAHAKIIEERCRNICELYSCTPDKLILEYHGNTQIKIKIQADHFEITNNFVSDNKKLIIDSMEIIND